MDERLASVELFAWLGEDEYGSGKIGIKQANVPAGTIAIVAIDRAKIEKHFAKDEAQAMLYGKRIYLCSFQFVEVLRETEHGK